MEIYNGHEQKLMKSQAMSTHGLEELLNGFRSPPPPAPEKKTRPEPEQALKCPRCDSTNTKFCYYNNYSLSQPRYFCKGCRRYWTKGGTLRNVPVGGGCRKNRRPSSSSSSSSPSFSLKRPQDDQTSIMRHLWPSFADHEHIFFGNPNPNPNPNPNGFLSLMRSEILETSYMNGFDEIYYGNNGRDVVEGMGGSNQNASDQRSCKVVMDLQMFNGADHGGLGMEYSSLHGLVNSSLM